MHSWRASSAEGQAPTRVSLLAGPYGGRTITIKGLPAQGAKVSFDSRGLFGDGVNHGDYFVVDVRTENHEATASWQPAT